MEITNYTPDVLLCLANLSNDEVFTPPNVANAMLDLLPEELWSDPTATFLDPCCKSGVFLREIAKRLIKGLEEQIPDLETRLDHIFKKQIFGIAITELTALLTRRSLYCSKHADSKWSVAAFDTPEGNIAFPHVDHTWDGMRCKYCGASWEVFGDRKETHAYAFIHNVNPEEIFKMKFDVIIGNPPYQLNVGNESGNKSKARAIYHNFIAQSMKLKPRHIVMIVPSRWMTRSVEGISDEWIDGMLLDSKIQEIHDFTDASLCFPGVSIEGGVNYFHWNKFYNNQCNYFLHSTSTEAKKIVGPLDEDNLGFVIRDINARAILSKIKKVDAYYAKNEIENFSSMVSPKDFFTNKEVLTSSWDGYYETKPENAIKYYLNKKKGRNFAWVKKSQVPKNLDAIPRHKVYIPAARGNNGDKDNLVLGTPFYGEPNSVCSQTYLVIGYKHNLTKEECKNIITYISTRFFRFLVSLKKKTQNGARGVYQLVPMQDFSKPWTDEELYAKYGLTQEEIDFIESMIRPMEVKGNE